jgi:signal transduction histidine kinase
MGSLFWHLTNRTAETEFIFNLFHFLVAGLTLLVLVHQVRGTRASRRAADRLLAAGFLLLALQCALLGLHFGARFFLDTEVRWVGAEPLSGALLACAVVAVAGGYISSADNETTFRSLWLPAACTAVVMLAVEGLVLPHLSLAREAGYRLAISTAMDSIALAAVLLAMRAVLRDRSEERLPSFVGCALIAMFLLLRTAVLFVPGRAAILAWNVEQHLLSAALFAFAWAAGERSHDLLDRIFVRLNLTFIILASLIMLITAGMEKFQYLRLAEERSLELAEFLRGHIVYDRARGDNLHAIFDRPDVMRHIVVEFGRLPELRQINVYLDGDRTSFNYTRDWEVKEEIAVSPAVPRAAPANSFEMVRLPFAGHQDNHIQLVGTMDYINENIGKYIITIYSVFTVTVLLATGIIGMIVADADRRLRKQYAELQDTHQQLAQAAKLASIGELAGGMAHEINTPITSILALASHLADGKGAAHLAMPHRRQLRVIVEQARRVSAIVGNLLTFSRQSHMELSEVHVADALDTALALVQFRLAGGSISVVRDIDGELPRILGDAGRLTEVFVNLLNNALDAMPHGGTVVIRASASSPPEGVQVEIADSGAGIAAEHLPRVFDPFFSTKAPGQGTGLGLSISHGIIEDHGGQIRIQSAPGAGTKVVVTLPGEAHRNGIAHSGHR